MDATEFEELENYRVISFSSQDRIFQDIKLLVKLKQKEATFSAYLFPTD